jgi:aspartyl-tRNA(Asn)/glutamyl-tRNA(Gln) amidotransferase subunit B
MDAPAKLTNDEPDDWELVIGMEVHAQVTSQAKLFSEASTEFGGEPNSHVSLIDAAMPGMLPVINRECVRQAIRTGFWLNAEPNLKSVFDRKNYFYPDLPQGYQISQYKSPIVGEGFVDVLGESDKLFRVRIERLHLEQDAGKLLHDQNPSMSLVDLNRAGVALMEIVTKPDLRSAADAARFFARIRMLLQHLGTCDGDMEKGHLRADVNVSVHKRGTALGTRCEIKNLNSFESVGDAVMWERHRQIEILEAGGTIEQETRLFDPVKGQTRSMRTKEEAHDYRYFPDPDLLPLELKQEFVDSLKAAMPEHPDDKRVRYEKEYGLGVYITGVLLNEKKRTDYFEAMVKAGAEPKAAANWLINEYLGRLNRQEKKQDLAPINARGAPTIGNFTIDARVVLGPVPASAGAAIVSMTSSGLISGKTAKDLLDYTWEHPEVDPKEYVERNNLRQLTDTGEIEKIVDDIVARNADKVADAKANPKAIGWFVGQVMKASGGKANPQAVNDLLKKKIGI